MAEKKDDDGGNNLVWGVIAFIFILMVIGTYFGRMDSSDVTDNFNLNEYGVLDGQIIDFSGNPVELAGYKVNEDGEIVSDGSVNSSTKKKGLIDNFLSADDLKVGDKFINKKLTSVRQSVAGAIIGEQKKREVGNISEGPISAYGQDWFRVDYKNDPDGWVSSDSITENIGLFRAMNIFPIIFDIVRPIGIILTIVFIILISLVLFRQKQINLLQEKKKQVILESIKKVEIKKEKSDDFVLSATNLEQAGIPSNLPTGDLGNLKFETRGQEMTSVGPKNKKWERIKRLVNSHNSSDWKQAIMEADVLLYEMLEKMGYEGDSIGEQLKQIEESDFITINKAWEAHKFRNHIAHKAGDFVFDKSEAERVIGLYEKVFKEFYYI